MSKINLADKVLFITGASRGIGRSIALRAAKDGAKIVLAAKTKDPHPKLSGTIFTVAEEIEKLGGTALPCSVDVRFEDQVQDAVDDAVKRFGGIDILVNNASAIQLTNTSSTPMKSYDLMNTINTRGTFLCSKLCLPHLKRASNPHILNLSPPLNLNPLWFSNHVAYTISKYGMSMCALGMAREFSPLGIAVNALWPRTAIYTAATKMLGGGEHFASQCRHPEIVSDAAYAILTRPSRDPQNSGNFYIDEEVLKQEGVTNFDKYAVDPGASLAPDFFLDVQQTEAPTEGTVSTERGSVDAIFDRLKSMLSEELVKTVGASYYFQLTGAEPGHWFIDLSKGSGCLGKASSDASEFDCRFELSSDQFVNMFEGKVIPTKAFFAGDLRIDGDVFAAVKLEKILLKMNK